MVEKRYRRVDASELTDLGFPKGLVDEAVRAEERGLLAVEPPEDLVQRVVRSCADLFQLASSESGPEAAPSLDTAPSPNYFATVMQLLQAVGVRDIALAFQAGAASTECQRLGKWPTVLAGSLPFALSSRQSPLVVVENHNFGSPAKWEDDLVLQGIRTACNRLNDFVSSSGIERSVNVVVLRPNVGAYRDDEISAIGELLRQSTCDVWWVPFSKMPRNIRDVMVVGNQKVLTRHDPPTFTVEPVNAIVCTEDSELAKRLRLEITEDIRSNATPIKLHGQLQPTLADVIGDRSNGIKIALTRVMEGRSSFENRIPAMAR